MHFAERFTPRATEIGIDVPVLLFSLGVSLVDGHRPRPDPRALAAAQPDGVPAGRAASAPTSGAGRLRARNLLIVTQVAISFVLLIGAGPDAAHAVEAVRRWTRASAPSAC